MNRAASYIVITLIIAAALVGMTLAVDDILKDSDTSSNAITLTTVANVGTDINKTVAVYRAYEDGMDQGVADLCQELGGTTRTAPYDHTWCDI